eukprot:scaffold1487_cov116-Isochrysis_galbana.AAC.2
MCDTRESGASVGALRCGFVFQLLQACRTRKACQARAACAGGCLVRHDARDQAHARRDGRRLAVYLGGTELLAPPPLASGIPGQQAHTDACRASGPDGEPFCGRWQCRYVRHGVLLARETHEMPSASDALFTSALCTGGHACTQRCQGPSRWGTSQDCEPA